MHTILRNKTEGLKRELLNFAQTLVRTPSVTGDESKVAGLVEIKMREFGYDKVFRDEAGNVVGVLLGREDSLTVLLNSHMDTVAAKAIDAPNDVRIENGRLYGLGAADCKAGLAAQVFAGALLRLSLLPLKGNLVVAATVSEENGRSAGVQALMERTLPALGMKPTFAILGEPTGLGLYYGHDGWMEVDIVVEGTNPFHVDDAAKAIYNDFDADSVKFENTPENFLITKPRFETVGGYRRATIPMSKRLFFGEEAGHSVNTIKQEASAIAHNSGAVAVDVVIRKETKKLYNGQRTTVQHVTHAWSIDPFHPMMSRSCQALAAAGCEVRPGKWQLGRLGMGTAGSVLVKNYQVPTIGYGPGDETQAHASGEYVATDRVVEALYGTASMVHGLIGIPVWGWTSDEI